MDLGSGEGGLDYGQIWRDRLEDLAACFDGGKGKEVGEKSISRERTAIKVQVGLTGGARFYSASRLLLWAFSFGLHRRTCHGEDASRHRNRCG